MKRIWVVDEFEKFESLVDLMEVTIRTLELENSRLRRKLNELREEKSNSRLSSIGLRPSLKL